jgi:oligosaccharide repeat unit polymerase
MSILIILIASTGGILLAKTVLGKWFNHLSVYTVVWGVSLILFEARYILYYPLEPETWLLIGSAWSALYLGALLVFSARFATSLHPLRGRTPVPDDVLLGEQRILSRFLWVFGLVGLLAALQHWSVLIAKFGSIRNVIIMANIVYSYLRGSNESPGMVPYLNAFSLAGTLLAGALTALAGRLKPAAVLPFVGVIVSELALMGRYKLVVAAILFVSGFFLGPRMSFHDVRSRRKQILRWALSVGVMIAVLVTGMELVRSTRGIVETWAGSSRQLNALRGASFITPSVYLYASIHHGVFNQYLKQDTERVPFGANTLAPVYRVLAKIGFDTQTSRYQIFYRTPAPANTGTYLREVHADFGVLGVLLIPFLMGLVTTVIWFRVQTDFSYAWFAVLACCFAVIGASLFTIPTRSGDLIVILLSTFLTGKVLDRYRTMSIAGRPQPTTGGVG